MLGSTFEVDTGSGFVSGSGLGQLLVRGSRGVGFRILEFSWVLAEWVSGFVFGLTFGVSRLGVRVGLWEALGSCRFGGLWGVCGFGLAADSWVLAEWVSGLCLV